MSYEGDSQSDKVYIIPAWFGCNSVHVRINANVLSKYCKVCWYNMPSFLKFNTFVGKKHACMHRLLEIYV